MKFLKPKALKKGDVIRVVASSSSFDKTAFLKGVAVLEDMGFVVKYQENIFEKKYYLAGSDKRRFLEFKQAMLDDSAKAILFARGGYGAMRILPDLLKFKNKISPKIVLGYSDITAILQYLQLQKKWVNFYGPVVAKDLKKSKNSLTNQSLFQALTSTQPLGEMQFTETLSIKSGTAEGVLVGGCLSLLVSLLGTPCEIDTNQKILFLEDVGEKPYEIDRMLMHLKLAGKLDKCRGIIFGSLADGFPAEYYIQTIQDIVSRKIPILFHFPAGHSKSKVTLPLGIKVQISSRRKSLNFLESALV